MNTSDVKLKIVTAHVQNPFTRKWGWQSYIYKCESSQLENCEIESLIASFVDCEIQEDAVLCAEEFIESYDDRPHEEDWSGCFSVDGLYQTHPDLPSRQHTSIYYVFTSEN